MNDDTPETDAVYKYWPSENAELVDAEFARKLERERDEARMFWMEEVKFHNRTHSELVQTQCKVLDLTQAILNTLEENRHLADGDNCTLAKLKSAIPDWK